MRLRVLVSVFEGLMLSLGPLRGGLVREKKKANTRIERNARATIASKA